MYFEEVLRQEIDALGRRRDAPAIALALDEHTVDRRRGRSLAQGCLGGEFRQVFRRADLHQLPDSEGHYERERLRNLLEFFETANRSQ